jgi:hypothetical protein
MPNAVDDTLGNRLTCCADSRSIALLMKVDIAMPGSDRTESPRRSAARQRTAAPTMVTAAIIIVTMPQITSFETAAILLYARTNGATISQIPTRRLIQTLFFHDDLTSAAHLPLTATRVSTRRRRNM